MSRLFVQNFLTILAKILASAPYSELLDHEHWRRTGSNISLEVPIYC